MAILNKTRSNLRNAYGCMKKGSSHSCEELNERRLNWRWLVRYSCQHRSSPGRADSVPEATFEKLTAEQGRLQDIVKVQNLSPEEVVRMNTEHESLTRDLEALKTKLAETGKLISKLEVLDLLSLVLHRCHCEISSDLDAVVSKIES